MTEIIFAAHGLSATGMRDSVEMVIGPQENFHTVMLSQEEGIESFKAELGELVHRLRIENKPEILILTDIPAGTPYNVGVELSLAYEGIAVLSGTNFSMVLAALEISGLPLDEMVLEVIATGRDAVGIFKEIKSAEEDF